MIRRNSGFTLVEILVATAIFAVIMVAALMMYDRNQQVFKQSVEAADLQQNTRVAFDKMVAEVRMAGFDYDRDGTPSKGGEFEQPDEQIEYAGGSAITFRANLDYDSNQTGDTDNGREPGLESTQFPVVTTNNDEIVTYALHSKTGPNTGTIALKLDLSRPRKAYPGGVAEVDRTVDNVDLSNANPPYELYRITIDPTDNTKFVRTMIADNIRSMKFEYFTDTLGTAAKKLTTLPLGDDAGRDTRSKIRSVRVELVGMNANRDVAYTNPTETDTSVTIARNYRTYKLESLLVPRNLGLRGLIEQEAQPPGAPTIRGVCIGACGLAYVFWDAPAGGPAVTSYTVTWDDVPTGPGDGILPLGNVLFGWAGGTAPMNPTTPYFFKVKALNGYGNNASATFPSTGTGIYPINRTKSEAPRNPATNTTTAGELTLVWDSPVANVSGSYGNFGGSSSCTVTVDAARIPSVNEITKYKVYRSLSNGITPTDSGPGANLLGTYLVGSTPLSRDPAGVVTFHDVSVASVLPTSSDYVRPRYQCRPYFYKIKAFEECANAGTANNNDDVAAVSNASAEFSGTGAPKNPPATPVGFAIAPTSGCGSTTCDVHLTWNEVNRDTTVPPNAILIDTYHLTRETWLGGTLQRTDPITVTVTPGNPATMKYDDVALPKDNAPAIPTLRYQYRYKLQAMQPGCTPASDSAQTPQQIFPCSNFTVNPPASGILAGNGTSAAPYMMTAASSTFTVSGSSPIDAVTANLVNIASGLATPLTVTSVGPIPSTTWTINVDLTANNGSIYRLDVTINDNANSCTTTNSPGTFLEDAPSSCCLEPYKLQGVPPPTQTFNNTVLTLDAATKTVNVKLINDCDQDLTITSLRVEFTQDTGNPKLRMQQVAFISPAGTETRNFGGTGTDRSPTLIPGDDTLPSAPVRVIKSVLANKTYTIGLTFVNRDPTLADILAVCITYTTPAGATFQCRIAPQASSNGTCAAQ